MRDPSLMLTAQSLQERAAALGLAVPAETAATMLERWLFSEKAYRVLKANGHHDTLKRLRTAAGPMPAAELAPKLKPMELTGGAVPSSLPRAPAAILIAALPLLAPAVQPQAAAATVAAGGLKRKHPARPKALLAKHAAARSI